MMKNVCAETSPRASTMYVQPIYMMKKVIPQNYPYSLYMDCTNYIYDEKYGSRDFP
jgi:hypothetical protein